MALGGVAGGKGGVGESVRSRSQSPDSSTIGSGVGSKHQCSSSTRSERPTKKPLSSASTAATSLQSQLGIPNTFEKKLDNWVYSAADESEKKKKLDAQTRILDAKKKNAETLNLSGLNLTEVPPLDALTQLNELDLSKNQLSTLPEGCFQGLTSLKELNLRNNQLSTLPKGCFQGLTSLK